jgi:hypothetical protein
MAEYIDRVPILQQLENTKINAQTVFINSILEGLLKKAPVADVVEVVHGEWINKNWLYRCSECDSVCPYDIEADVYDLWTCHYCPNCGAKMDGKDEKI